MTDARPMTVLERAAARLRSKDMDLTGAMWVLAASNIVVLQRGEYSGEGFPPSPLMFKTDFHPMLATFSHPDMAAQYLEDATPVVLPAFEVLRRMPPTSGLVLNPATPDLRMELLPDTVQGFVRELARDVRPSSMAADPRPVDGAALDQRNVALREAVRALAGGTGSREAVHEAFLAAPVLVPSTTEPTESAKPLVAELEGGPHMLVAATTKALDRTKEHAKHALRIPDGKTLLGLVGEGMGLIVQFDDDHHILTPDEVQALRPAPQQPEER